MNIMGPGKAYRQKPAGLNNGRISSRKVFFLLLVCAAGSAYLIWIKCGGPALPCLFHLVTGLDCPGCGITRMFLAASRMDFEGAKRANPFLYLTFPCPAFILAHSACRWVKSEKISKKTEACAAIYCIGLVLFGIFRNLV